MDHFVSYVSYLSWLCCLVCYLKPSETADLLALVCDFSLFFFVTFQYGISDQV